MSNKQKTNLTIQIKNIVNLIKSLTDYKLNLLSIELLSILLGFFASTALSTIPAQTGDWGVVAAAIIVTNQEIISKITYQRNILKYYKYNILLSKYLKYCNNIKIGIIYGLFVDAFKLGS